MDLGDIAKARAKLNEAERELGDAVENFMSSLMDEIALLLPQYAGIEPQFGPSPKDASFDWLNDSLDVVPSGTAYYLGSLKIPFACAPPSAEAANPGLFRDLLVAAKYMDEDERLEDALKRPEVLAFCAGLECGRGRFRDAERERAQCERECRGYPKAYAAGRAARLKGTPPDLWLQIVVIDKNLGSSDDFSIRIRISGTRFAADFFSCEWRGVDADMTSECGLLAADILDHLEFGNPQPSAPDPGIR